MPKMFTAEQIEWLKANAYGKWIPEITQAYNDRFNTNLKETQIRNALRCRKIKTNAKQVRGMSQKIRRILTPAEDAIIRERFQDSGTGGYLVLQQFIKENFGKELTVKQVRSYCQRKKLRFGIDSRFKKGSIPANKGKKLTEEQRKAVAKTWFKKGRICTTKLPVGSERFNRGTGSMMIKIAEPNVWRIKSRWLWEQETGEKLQRSDKIITLDGNPKNIVIENLMKVTATQHSIMNNKGLRSQYPEFTKLGVVLADLIHAKREAMKNAKAH